MEIKTQYIPMVLLHNAKFTIKINVNGKISKFRNPVFIFKCKLMGEIVL
jgi:hypothetical protein